MKFGFVRFLFVFSIIGLFPASIHAAQKIFYGSRAGMTVTVISASGLDTDDAIIVTRHTRDDAVRYCVEYVGHATEQCIDDALAWRLNNRVTANCRTSEFVDFGGRHYRFEGKLQPNDDPLALTPKYAIRDLLTDEVADGSMAGGYPVNIGIFQALCPHEAPSDE